MPSINVDWYHVAGPPFGGDALQAAINAAIAAGGGVVYLPSGEYPITVPKAKPLDPNA